MSGSTYSPFLPPSTLTQFVERPAVDWAAPYGPRATFPFPGVGSPVGLTDIGNAAGQAFALQELLPALPDASSIDAPLGPDDMFVEKRAATAHTTRRLRSPHSCVGSEGLRRSDGQLPQSHCSRHRSQAFPLHRPCFLTIVWTETEAMHGRLGRDAGRCNWRTWYIVVSTLSMPLRCRTRSVLRTAGTKWAARTEKRE